MKIKLTWEEGFDLWSKLLSYRNLTDNKTLDNTIQQIEQKIFVDKL
jgi:hypothetical protein